MRTVVLTPIIRKAAYSCIQGWAGGGSNLGAYEWIPAVQPPRITPRGGACASPLTVTITCPTPGAQIRVTWGGNEPTTASLLYKAPLVLRAAPGAKMTVKAKAYKAGYVTSPSATASYTFK